MKKIHQAVALLLAGMLLCSCGNNTTSPSQSAAGSGSESTSSEAGATSESGSEASSGSTEDSQSADDNEFKLKKSFKAVGDTNPIASNYFFADPTAVEYEGRLYVYGTCDSQQYIANGKKGDNGYGAINMLACYSTDDMKNWTYHGDIKTKLVCRWAGCSWAPSIVSRKTDSGETEFFLFFCNSGGGIGVMKSNSPLGPWEDPVGHAVVRNEDLGGDPVCWCFDPGVVIDDKGDAYIAFGGGDPMHDGETGLYTGNCRIARLNKDLTAIEGEVVKVPTPYHFEANEINYINGKYILTYCSNYKDRNEWPDKYAPLPASETDAMCYMVSETPLNADSWVYCGEYLKGPQSQGAGLEFSNNHSHLQKYQGKYYLLYQNVSLLTSMKKLNKAKKDANGYRSVGVDELEVDEENGRYGTGKMTMKGVDQLKNFDPFRLVEAETANTTAEVEFNTSKNRLVASGDKGSWICLTSVDFQDGASKLEITVKGSGALELRLDDKESKAAATISFDSKSDYSTVSTELKDKISGVHDLYIVYLDDGIKLDSWQVSK